MARHAHAAAGPEVKAIIPPAFAGLFQPYRHKGFYGGRGSAKSHSMAEVLASRLPTTAAKPVVRATAALTFSWLNARQVVKPWR